MANWILLFSGAYLVFINFFVSLTVLPQYVLVLGGSDFQSGLQNTVFFLTAVLLRFYFGPFTDRKGRKIPVLIGTFVFATSPGLFLLSTSVNMLLLCRIYQAIGLATFLSGGSSLVADLAPEGKTGAYLGYYRLVLTMAVLSGPSLALSVISRAGYESWFILSMILGLMSLLLLLPVRAGKFTPAQLSAVAGTASLLRDRSVLPVLFYIGLISISYGAILSFAVVYVAGVTTISNPGIFFFYFGCGGIAANLGVGRLSDIRGRERLAWPLLMLLGTGTALLYLIAVDPVMIASGAVLTGFGVSGSLLVFIAWLVDVVKTELRATALSLQESVIDIAVAVGSFLAGVGSYFFGLALSFVVVGIIVFLPGLASLLRANHCTVDCPVRAGKDVN